MKFIATLLILSLVFCQNLLVAADRQTELARAKARQSIIVQDLRSHIDFLAADTLEGRAAGTRGGRAAGQYLIQELQKLGWKPGSAEHRYDQPFNANMRNILAIWPGSDPQLKQEFIVIGAHYDHVGFGTKANSNGPIGYVHNGADDNASGTSALLEFAQAVALLPQAPARSILLAFWDGEEVDLLGSKHWLKQPTIPLKQVKAVLNFDMLGRLREERVEVYGVRTAAGWRKLVADVNQADPLNLDYTWKMKHDSDHYPFFVAKIPVVMLHTGLHDQYHRPSDDVDTLNLPGLERVSRLVFDLSLKLADDLPIGEFRDESKIETDETQKLVEKPLAPFPGRLGIRWTDRDPQINGLPITDVTPRSPADIAGLKIGDRILKWNGYPVPESEQFRQWTLAAPRDTQFTIQRAGQADPLDVKVKLNGDSIRWGLTWREDNAEPGVVYLSRIIAGTPAELAGVQQGDRIWAINGRSFANQDELEVLLQAEEITLSLERQGKYRTAKVRALSFPPVTLRENNR